MTTPHDNQAPGSVADELTRLGELAPAPDERHVDDDPDVRTVATLVAIAHADLALTPPLSALSQRRVWNVLQGRVAAIVPDVAPVVTDPHAPAANDGPGWRAVVAGLVAAAVLILPRIGPPSEHDGLGAQMSAESAELLGARAREGVSKLGDSGEARARSLASEYASRLSREGGDSP